MQISVVCGAFLLSGASALIFETLWLRIAGLTFGNAVISAALVLSSFMAGLAIGSGFAAFGHRPRYRPLLLYAILELIVALLGCTIVFALPFIGTWAEPVFGRLWLHTIASNFLRFALSFAVLCLPAAAMGATLPVVVADPLFGHEDFRRYLGLFYGCNTLGAVCGALAGESWLVAMFGLPGTALAAGILNCAAAGMAVLLLRRYPVTIAVAVDENAVPGKWLTSRSQRLVLVTFGTGAILLSLELTWFRFLRLYVLSSPMAFAVMLSVVLVAIGLGALSFAVLPDKRGAGSVALPTLLFGTAITTLLAYVFFPISILQQKAGSSWQDFMLDSWWEVGVLGIALMFPTAYLSGLLFPVVVSELHGAAARNRTTTVGVAILFNTVGAALGPLLTTFLFLPLLGFERTLVLGAAGYVLLALFAAEWKSIRRTQAGLLTTIAVGLMALSAFVFFPYQRDQEHFAHARHPYEADGAHLMARSEGVANTWQLLQRDFMGEPYYWRLMSDSFSMSSTQFPNQRYMRLFAYLPLALEQNPADALLICYGCGVTADAMTKDTRLKRIDVVDISREVLRLAEHYSAGNALRDPRVTTFVEDGRFFLHVGSRQYDLITGEPPPPKVEGTVNLYTREFFRSINARLKKGGMATFWLPIYQLTVEDTKAILRGFHEAFPTASVWASSDEEWIMLGIKDSPGADRAPNTIGLWDSPAARADLQRIGVEKPGQLAALFLMDGDQIDELTGAAPPLTDWFPKRLSEARADLAATHDLAAPYMKATEAAQRFRRSPLMSRLWPETLRFGIEPFFTVREIRYRSAVQGGGPNLSELDFYLRRTDLKVPVLEVFHTDSDRVAIAQRAAANLMGQMPNELGADLVAGALARRDFADAILVLERERSESVAKPDDLLLLTYIYCLSGNIDAAEKVASTMPVEGGNRVATWLWRKLQAEFGFRPPG